MAQDYGAAQPIYDVAKNVYNKVSGALGDPSKSASKKPSGMDIVSKDNANRKSWEDATKFTGPAKQVSTQKPTSSKQAPAKSTVRKKLTSKR